MMEGDRHEKGTCNPGTPGPTVPRMSKGVKLPIAGVNVEFPFEPYPVQKYMMSQIIMAINKTQNCLLESPTGTGKTLGLLCSSLAWQEKERRVLAELQEELKKEKEEKLKLGTTNKASASNKMQDVTKEEEKHREVTKECSEEDFPTEYSSDEDIFQPPKRKRQSSSGIFKVYNVPSDPVEKHQISEDKSRDNQNIRISVDEAKAEVDPPLEPFKDNEKLEFQLVEEEEINKFTPPKIYYGTRTHKQITQVVDQLNKTSYGRDVRMTILAARDHTCVNPTVKSRPNVTDHCRRLLDPASGEGCSYYNAATKVQNHGCIQELGLPMVFDIEDIVKMGARRRFCPYFSLRNISKTSNIVFCPYNYLIHPEMRESMQIHLRGSIVIMDEAHNIEDICRETASLWLKADDISAAIKDCREHQHRNMNEEEYKVIEEYLVKLEYFIITEGPKQIYSTNNEANVSWLGQIVTDKLHVAGVTLENFNNMLHSMAEIEKAKAEDPESNTAVSGVVKRVCTDIKCCFKYLYQQPNESKFQGFFHREIGFKEEESSGNWFSKHRRSFSGDASSGERTWKYALRVLCLDPALVFSELLAARTVILASGTLSPLDSFKTELGVNFNYVVKGKHVVPPTNLYVSTISNGPTGVALRGVYGNTNTYEYQDELGKVVVETSKIVPHGVLCFFPSYALMNKLQERWASTGLLDELSEVKEVFWEPRNKEEMENVMHDFTLRIDESREGLSIGAIMFGVFRGKIAEGIDFSDENARVVLAVGIPFANRNIMEVDLKIKYNDSRSLTNKSVLGGDKWYRIQAYRALNQALGRCIRHQNDWGAIILVDVRFSQREVQENLPIWIRSVTRTYQNWNRYAYEIQAFCSSMSENAE